MYISLLQKMEGDFASEKGKLEGIQCDLTKEEEILEAFKWVEKNWGAVNILINNAGYLAMTSLQGNFNYQQHFTCIINEIN